MDNADQNYWERMYFSDAIENSQKDYFQCIKINWIQLQ
jgi:hypothetical protein